MCIPLRVKIGLQMFFTNAVLQTLRQNFDLALNAMVIDVQIINVTDAFCPEDVFDTQKILSDYGPRYDWKKDEQELVEFAYHCGFLATAIPGGMLAEQFGSRAVVTIVMFASGWLTIITPFACAINFMMVVALRFFLGLLGGIYAPCVNLMIVHWSPLIERGKYLVIMFGNTVGIVFVYVVLPLVMEYMGWYWLFFIPGIMSILMSGLWWKVIRNTPKEHPWITKAEKRYIAANVAQDLKTVQRLPPFKHIFLNLPLWSLTALHLGDQWGMYTIISVGPTFYTEVLGMPSIQAGRLASVPCISRVFFGLLFGSLSDYFRKNKLVTITAMRKGFVAFSHFMPGIFLSALNFTACNRAAAITLMTWSLAFSGAATVTNLPNSQDLGPNYAGTLYGVLNCVAGAAAFLIPFINMYTTDKPDSTLYEWYAFFTIATGVYFVSGITFVLFGTTNRQAFNEMVT